MNIRVICKIKAKTLTAGVNFHEFINKRNGRKANKLLKPTPTGNGKICVSYVCSHIQSLYTQMCVDTDMCVIMRQTINFFKFICLGNIVEQPIETERYYIPIAIPSQGKRYTCMSVARDRKIPSHTHRQTHQRAEYIHIFIFIFLRNFILNIFALWRWLRYVKVKYT